MIKCNRTKTKKQKIKDNTDFKNFKQLYKGGNSHEIISNNLYIVSK